MTSACVGEGKDDHTEKENAHEQGSKTDRRDGTGDVPVVDVLTERSSSSSQLLSGPASTSGGPGVADPSGDGSPELSIETPLSNDESYFILDDGGRHVLDDQGSPARARKWKPGNATQRERYARLHQATKGSAPTCKWLQSVLVSPHHLNVPAAQIAQNANTIKGASLGTINTYITAAGSTSQSVGKVPATPLQAGGVNGADRRRATEIAKQRRRVLAEERRRQRPKQLDGFMLMDACGCELPDEGRRADVSGRGLIGVVREDLSYFIRLRKLDVGDNSLPFGSFARLPRLEELFIPCNNIHDLNVGRRGYSELQRLDLSYNNIGKDALMGLGHLPNLRDLDLTCNGLTELPPAFGRLLRLQKLTLERNQLEKESVFDILSNLPALRELTLAFNYFTRVDFTPDSAEYIFPLLESLDLGFNYINQASDVESLILLGRLQTIILYGNPLAGPTGEDPLGLCVEDLISKADRVREGWASHPIEVITEMPRKRHTGRDGEPGVGSGRRRPYSDIGITMVDEGYLPSALDFRAAGNESIFRFESRRRPTPDVAAVDGLSSTQYEELPPEDNVKATLRRAREICKRRVTGGPKPVGGREKDGTFLTGVDRQEEDDDGFLLAKAHVEGEYGQGHSGEGPVGLAMADAVLGGSGGMSARLLQRPVDPVVRGDPVKLKMALNALRYTLKHPVSSSMDVWFQRGKKPTGGSDRKATHVGSVGRDCGVGRKTAAARARQLPRRPYQLLKTQHGKNGIGDVGGHKGLGGIMNGGPHSSSAAPGGLERIDAVLTSMGVGTDEMTLEKRAEEREEGTRAEGRPGLSSIIRTVNVLLDENEI